MESQYSLFDQPVERHEDLRPIVQPRKAAGAASRASSIDEAFRDFHRANPHVYDGLRRVALEMKRGGHKQWSIKAAFEVLRWQYIRATKNADGFKLSNNFTAPYARLLMRQEPELKGFFVTKERRSGGEFF